MHAVRILSLVAFFWALLFGVGWMVHSMDEQANFHTCAPTMILHPMTQGMN